jgi:hypothetical protein
MARKLRWTGWIVGVLLGVGIFPFMVSTATAAPECGELLKEKCQMCHSLVRTCDGLGRDKESWKKTIAKMAHYSSVITDKDQKILAKCLTKQEKDVVALCR